jgi:hypothetical protein
MRQGFVSALILAIIAIAITGILLYTAPRESNNLAASIQTQLTDTIGTFRTNVNTSLTTLDAAVAAVTSTIATYGNIVTQNTPLGTAVGGTGTTTLPSANQIMSANGSNPAWKTFSVGAGLNVTNTASGIQVGTVGFDNTANISFTGNNTFSGTSGFTGTSTFSGQDVHSVTSTFNGPAVFNGGTQGIETILSASGAVVSTYSSTATTTLVSVTVNSSTIQNPVTTRAQGIEVKEYFVNFNSAANADKIKFNVNLNGNAGANSFITGANASGIVSDGGTVDLQLWNTSTTNNYFTVIQISSMLGGLATTTIAMGYVSFTPTSTLTLNLTTTNVQNASTEGLNHRFFSAQYLTQ